MMMPLQSKLFRRLKDEFEIYILMAIFGIWYIFYINGAMKGDETIFALQGYYFMKGNMSAEQFRPMSRYFYWLGQLLFGRTTFGAKFFIFLLGIFTVYLTYLVGKALGNRVKGFLSALIIGIIPLYGDLSVSGLMDIILAFFVMLLLFFTLKYLRTQEPIRKQQLLFLIGVLSISTLATKLYGVFFSLVVFLFLIYTEWKTVRTIRLFKRKNITTRLKKFLIFLPVFIVMGVLFGLLIRKQMSDLWENAGEKGKTDILDLLPGFMNNIINDMNGSQAYIFFIVFGLIILMILWVICALVVKESLKVLKCLVKRRALDPKFHMLIYLLGTVIGFIIIYLPHLDNPVTLFTQISFNQAIHLKQSSPRIVGGVEYDSAPWWSYLYWFNEYLSIMFIVGTVLSLLYTAYRFIRKESIVKEHKLLFLYTFVPFVLLSSLSLKQYSYFVILFPLFTIYMVVQVTLIVERGVGSLKSDYLKGRAKLLSIFAIVALILLPGPLWMTLDDSQLGYDSGYDTVGELIVDYIDGHPNEEVRVIAFDTLSVEFYLSNEELEHVEILPLFSDNFSKDIIGRPYIYVPNEELYEMVLNNDIDILVDEPANDVERPSLVRTHVSENITNVTQVNEDVFVYYL